MAYDLLSDLEQILNSDGILKLNTCLPNDTIYHTQTEKDYNSCTQVRAACDIGSSSTKCNVAEVDICAQTILKSIYEDSIPAHYKKDLKDSKNKEFSQAIQIQGLSFLEKFKAAADSYNPIQFCGIATAAFRSAENGPEFIDKINEELQINTAVISQDKEGELAFFSAVSKAKAGPHNTIVWDIGGRSMQLTALSKENVPIMAGNEIASATFKEAVIEQIKKGHNTPNPMNKNEIDQAIQLAKELIDKPVEEGKLHIKFITNDDRKDDQIFGVGAVHNSIAKHYANHFGKKNDDSYDKNSIKYAIDSLVGKSDSEIMEIMYGHKDLEYAKSELTSLILIYAVMEKFGINKVSTLAGNNLEGLLVRGCAK